ncbi:MAG: hypothetical protein A2252_04715 [Elusimicrobia bacterium RIFOXYA2_FULL_39_19]|nr:MAG: hypothetical protein A2252_04715 [Elusimicrobia bacterium RIFOXYA2_FULL_39_19]
MKLVVAGLTDVGMKRQNNEDNLSIDEEIKLLIVCDGAGGQATGEVASKIAVDVILDQVRRSILKKERSIFGEKNPNFSDETNQLASSIRFANQVIFEAAKKYPQNSGMATTVVAVLVKEDNFVFCNVGDSRIYLIREGQFTQITNDHSLVMEQLRRGLITKEQAEKSEYKNILVRALGPSQAVEVDLNEMPAKDGDLLILCSDGLTHTANDKQIYELIKNDEDPVEICKKLVKLANDMGGADNTTVVVAKLLKEEGLVKNFISFMRNKYAS